jgi:predicted DNA-binding transcriptional regulator YafY
MTRPTARVMALLELLQSGGVRTVAELAGRLGVDERTVRRYVDHLVDLDVPVESVRGRYGGYRLGPGYRLPPLMLTDDEALAVLLGLAAGRRAGLLAGTGTASETATAKIRRVLPERLARRLDALLGSLAFTAPPAGAAAADRAVLLSIADAVRHRRPVSIRYTSADGRRSERVLSGLATAPYRHRVSLLILGTAEQIRARLPASVATLEELPTGAGAQAETEHWFRAELRVEQLDWLPPLLASLDRPFVIERPDELRGLTIALAGRLAAAARRSPRQDAGEDDAG